MTIPELEHLERGYDPQAIANLTRELAELDAMHRAAVVKLAKAGDEVVRLKLARRALQSRINRLLPLDISKIHRDAL